MHKIILQGADQRELGLHVRLHKECMCSKINLKKITLRFKKVDAPSVTDTEGKVATPEDAPG